MLPNTAAAAVPVYEPCPKLGWVGPVAGRRRSNTWRAGWVRLSSKVVVVIATVRAHCQGQHPTRGRRHHEACFDSLCIHVSKRRLGRLGGSTDNKESRGYQSMREAGRPGKEESQARVEVRGPMGIERSSLSLFGERLKQTRWRAVTGTLSTASARLVPSPRQSMSYALFEAEGSRSSRGVVRQ